MSAINSKCLLCGNEQIETIHKGTRDKADIDVLKCSECGLVFLSSFSHIDNYFYENSKMLESNADYESILNEGQIDCKRRIGYLEEKIVNKTVLDFGCGAGNFLFLAKNIAKRVDGCELDQSMRSGISKKFNTEPSRGRVYRSMDNIKLKYDIITMFHVIEHLENPVFELVKLKGLLEKKGEIIIETPNADDALLTLYNCDKFADFTYWGCHLVLYNSETIKKLIKKAGMKVNYIHHIQRYPLSNHLYWLSEGKPSGQKHWNFLDSTVLKQSYEASLANIGKTDTIMLSVGE